MTKEKSTESAALDAIAELVDVQYPKGTEDTYGKALRHQLHKAGRLNEPDVPGDSFAVLVIRPGFDVENLRNEASSRFDIYIERSFEAASKRRQRELGSVSCIGVVIRSAEDSTGSWYTRIPNRRAASSLTGEVQR